MVDPMLYFLHSVPTFFSDLEEGGKYKKVAHNTEINDIVH